MLKRLFSFKIIHEPFLIPYSDKGQLSKILRLTNSFLRRNINACLFILRSFAIILISYDVSTQFNTDSRHVLLEPVSSDMLIKILMKLDKFLDL